MTKFGYTVSVLVIACIALFAIGRAQAHVMNETECKIFAQDFYVTAKQRDLGITYKMQFESMAYNLEACPVMRPTVCIYKDDEDRTQAQTALGWVYADPEGSKMTPANIRARLESRCVAAIKSTSLPDGD
jgi:hypothetical protein